MNTKEIERPALIPQSRGGALLAGGKPGNKGGSGRPPGAIRRAMRVEMDQRITILCEIADDAKNSPADRMRAIDLLGKYGLGARFAMEVAGKMARRPDVQEMGEDPAA